MLCKSNKCGITIFFIIILITSVTIQAQEQPTEAEFPLNVTYTLDDLYVKALENSETIKLSEEDLYIAKKTKDKAIAVIFPRLTAFGQYTRFSEEVTQTVEIMPNVPPMETSLQPEWRTAWGLRLDKSFTLNGRELIAYGIAKDRIEMSEYDLNTVKEEYLLSVAAAYYDVLRAEKAKEIALANVKRLEKHKQAVDSRLKIEEVTKTALYRVQAELSGSRTDLIKAENNLKFARAVLGRIVGLTDNFTLEAPDVQAQYSVEYDLESLKQEALVRRADLKSAEMRQQIAEDEVKFARSDYWPRVTLEAVYQNMDSEPESEYDESRWIAARIDFTIFDGGLRRAEVSEAKAKKRKADLAMKNLEKDISIAVEKAYLDLIALNSALKSLDDQLQYSSSNFNAVSKQFKFGLSDSVDVMDANTLLVTSESEFSDAHYRSQLSELRLERAKGTFLDQTLEKLGIKTVQ